MVVVDMQRYRSRETAAVLRDLLEMAEAGELTGLALCFKDSSGAEQTAFTGEYKARPGDAVGAVMRLSWQLTRAHDERFGPP